MAVETVGNETATERQTNVRWMICALLFFATTINYIDRQILSLLKETLDKELGWNNAEFGLVNSVFQFSYGMALLGFGWFVDRFGTKIGYAVSITMWSIAAMGHGLVHSVNGFFVARTALGLGEAGNFPSAIKTVAQWFPKKERALSTSIFNSGANVGALVAPATIPFLAAAYGWRSAFIVAGLAGFVWLVLWVIFYEIPERHKRINQRELEFIRSDRDEQQPTRKMSWGSLLGYRQTWSFIVAKFLTDPVWWFFLIWLPDFFKKTRGLDIKTSWKHIVTIYGIVTLLSIFGGWLPGYLVQRGIPASRARKIAMLIFAFLVVPIVFVTRTGDWTAVTLIGLAGAAHQAWSANLFTTVSDMFPKKAVASVVGLGGMAGSAGGIMFPYITGLLLDHFQKAGNVTAGYTILFSICGGAYLLAFVLNNILAPRFEQMELPELEQRGFPVV